MNVRPSHAVLAGLLLAAAAVNCAAQQFRVERDFDFVRRSSDGRPLQNIYWVSLPLLPLIPDAANTAATQRNKCVGDPGGPATGDGVINSDDLICSWWTARADPATAGTFVVSKYDRNTCTPTSRIGTVLLGGVTFSGVVFTLEPELAYQVIVAIPVTATYSPRNHAVLAGDHDPAWTGRSVTFTPNCPSGAPNCCGASVPRLDLVSVPYHVLYTHADEILCGLEGVDWQDVNGDGRPDTCWDDADGDGVRDVGEAPTGVFDGRVAIAVSTRVNTEDVNTMVSRTVTVALGRLRFSGTNFGLTAGEGYQFQLSPTHAPTLFFPPHS